MTPQYTANGPHRPEIFLEKWLWFVLLGNLLIVAGIVAILLPALSEIGAGRVLGSVLVISGIVQVAQAMKVTHWRGFVWHVLLGILAVVGGVLIYMNPFAGVITLTLLIAIIFAVHGVTQLGFAMKVRGQPGWRGFLISGLIAIVVSALLLLKLPYSHFFTPATMAGISLLFAGGAYVAMALASHRAGKESQ